jgi:hypothetical protein
MSTPTSTEPSNPFGHEAERKAIAQLRRRLPSTWQVFSNLRIRRRSGERYEADVLLVGPREAYLLELKEWSGRVDVEGRDVVQYRRNGERVEHGDLFRKIQRREEIMVEQSGFDPDAGYLLHNLVVFTNSNVRLEPGARDWMEHLTTWTLLLSALPRRPGLLMRLVRWLFRRATLTPDMHEQGVRLLKWAQQLGR